MTRSRFSPAILGLATGVALVGAVVAHYGLRMHTIQPDEALSLGGMRFFLHHGPSALWDWGHVTDRGLERVTPIVLGLANWIGGGGAGGVRGERIAIALLYASAAVPAFLLARDLGLRRGWSLAAALLAVLTPFAVFATSFLNTAAAYATVLLAVWGSWRAVVRPSPRNDLLAVALIALAGMARVGNIVVGVALPVGVFAHLLRDRLPGEGLQWRTLPSRLWRDHAVLVALGVVVVAGLVVAGPTKVGGAYVLHFDTVPGRLRERFGIAASQLGVASGYLPVVVAGAWVLRQVLRPSTLRTGTFAWMSLAAFAALVFASTLAGPEERYIAPIFPLVAVVFVTAVARRELAVVGIALMALIVGRAISHYNPITDIGPYTYFASPAGQFFSRVVLGKASLAIPWEDFHVLRTVLWAGAIAMGAALVLMHKAPRLVGVLLIISAGAYGATSGVYAMRKFSAQVGIPGLRWEQQTWIDRATHGEHVAILDYDPLISNAFRPLWNEAYVWNRSVIGTAYLDQLSYGCCPPEDEHWELHPDVDTGRVRLASYGAYGQGIALPRLLLWTPHFSTYGFETKVVAQSDYLPATVQLLRRTGPLRLSWSVAGTSPDGYVLGSGARIRVFRPRADCMSVGLRAPAGFRGRRVIRVAGRRVVLRDEIPTDIKLRVHRTGSVQDLALHGKRTTPVPDRFDAVAQIAALSRAPC